MNRQITNKKGTSIGADKNEYTSYVIVGASMTPFNSKLTVCVKRFDELRQFAQQQELPRVFIRESNGQTKNEYLFPSHMRLFGFIDERKLHQRKQLINEYFSAICENANVTRHPLFLSFFRLTGVYPEAEERMRLDSIEQTLVSMSKGKIYKRQEKAAMGALVRHHSNNNNNDKDNDKDTDKDEHGNTKRNNAKEKEDHQSMEHKKRNNDSGNAGRNTSRGQEQNHSRHHPHYSKEKKEEEQGMEDEKEEEEEERGGEGGGGEEEDGDSLVMTQEDMEFDIPSDIHHYNDPKHQLICTAFDMIQKQIEIEEWSFNKKSNHSNAIADASQHDTTVGIGSAPNEFPQRLGVPSSSPMSQSHRNRQHLHIRVSSIIASTFSPAELIGTAIIDEEEEDDDGNGYRGNDQFAQSQANGYPNGNKSTKLLPKGGVVLNRKRSSLSATNQLTTQFTGPRIIRSASEATSEQSLSYKIPTHVGDVWRKVIAQIDNKHKVINKFKDNIAQTMYPIIQVIMNGIIPAIKTMLREPSASSPDLKPKSHDKDISRLQLDTNFNDEKDQGMLSFNNNNNKKKYYIYNFEENKRHPVVCHTCIQNQKHYSDESHVHKDISLFDFPFINAMYQYCLTEVNLYEYFLAFERLAIEEPFGPIMGQDFTQTFGSGRDRSQSDQTRVHLKPQLSNSNSSNNNWTKLGQNDNGISNASLHHDPGNAKYKYMHLLEYNFELLSKMCSEEFEERMRYVMRVHAMIRRFICEIFYEFVRAFSKCLRLLINYRDTFEKTSLVDEDAVEMDPEYHEERLIGILRDSGYNMSWICDDLIQRSKIRFGKYSEWIYTPLMDGINTIAQLCCNALSLIIVDFSFENSRPKTIQEYRRYFIKAWKKPIDMFIFDLSEAIFEILYQSTVGLICSTCVDLLKGTLRTHVLPKVKLILRGQHKAANSDNHNKSQTSQKKQRIIPKAIKHYISLKEIVDIVTERVLYNVVSENLTYLRFECEKKFYKTFEKNIK
ncbi:hypothetical protein RFI_17838 [Reticulomyxa filosa]|uniref:PX domain-containing protein n=1 Tax=Reticulomyxa filosa TaxID=46433 RepID=X6MZF6_RETFI|nr:hypothetical protein RFI_17838 [Reticulomyxa filosa]|eukprot:ETO19395.1 hypothetical protein RFI_17838 [Reticulomyxa filosa]